MTDQMVALHVQRLVVAEDARLVEGDPPAGGEVGGDARARGDAIVQRNHARQLPLQPPRRMGKA